MDEGGGPPTRNRDTFNWMHASGKIERSESEPRPIIVVAEREFDEPAGFRGMDLLVMLYRRRWIIAVAWGVVLGVSLVLMPISPASAYRWSVVVASENASAPSAPIDQLAGLLMARASSLGEAAVKESDVEVQYPRMGTGTKAEVIRNAILIRGSGDSAEAPPRILEDLVAVASDWTRQYRSDYIARQTETVTVARERVKALATDPNATLDGRAAAELMLATAEVNLKFPPTYTVRPPESAVKPPELLRAWGIRLVATWAMALALVSAVAGWSAVARVARA
jgi:hypothetical protein